MYYPSVSEQAIESWKRYIRRDDSHLVDLFVGQLKSTLQCTHCNHESVTFEPFWDLSLGIPSRAGEVSLLECFDTFTKEETLDGDEMPVDNCLQLESDKHCKVLESCSVIILPLPSYRSKTLSPKPGFNEAIMLLYTVNSYKMT